MPLSGLDPSMLLGFLCKDEADYQNFRMRVTDMCKKHKPIFSIQAEPPTWSDDSDDVGLESVSEPDMDHDQEDGEEGAFFSNSPSPVPPSVTDSSSLDPITPSTSTGRQLDPMRDEEEFEPDVVVEDDEDWVDPSPPPSSPRINSKDASRAPSSDSKKGKEAVHHTTTSLHPPQHFPFPSSDDGEDSRPLSASSRALRDRGEAKPTPHIRSIRARNGGRTQSGGVKGVYVDSGDES